MGINPSFTERNNLSSSWSMSIKTEWPSCVQRMVGLLGILCKARNNLRVRAWRQQGSRLSVVVSFLEAFCYDSWARSMGAVQWLLNNHREASVLAAYQALGPFQPQPRGCSSASADSFLFIRWQFSWAPWLPVLEWTFLLSLSQCLSSSDFSIYPSRLQSCITSIQTPLRSQTVGLLINIYWVPSYHPQCSQKPNEVDIIPVLTKDEAKT